MSSILHPPLMQSMRCIGADYISTLSLPLLGLAFSKGHKTSFTRSLKLIEARESCNLQLATELLDAAREGEKEKGKRDGEKAKINALKERHTAMQEFFLTQVMFNFEFLCPFFLRFSPITQLGHFTRN